MNIKSAMPIDTASKCAMNAELFNPKTPVVEKGLVLQLEAEFTKILAAANIQAGVFEQTVAENQELREDVERLTKELEAERSERSKRPHRHNIALEIRKCADRIMQIGDTCSCGQQYETEHHGCSDRLFFVCRPCNKEILIG